MSPLAIAGRGLGLQCGAMKPKPHTTQAEHWQTAPGSAPIAVLDIPGLLSRVRVFDIDVMLIVDVPAAAQGAWLELGVEIDGRRQWSRRSPAHNPGHTDSLEYHQRVRLEASQGTRIRAVAAVNGLRIRQLQVQAHEEI